MPCTSSISAVPHANGKSQPWIKVYPPRADDLQGVVESKGAMLLLDGTGGSGTVAVPNAVTLPPKSQEQSKEKEKEEKKDKK